MHLTREFDTGYIVSCLKVRHSDQRRLAFYIKHFQIFPREHTVYPLHHTRSATCSIHSMGNRKHRVLDIKKREGLSVEKNVCLLPEIKEQNTHTRNWLSATRTLPTDSIYREGFHCVNVWSLFCFFRLTCWQVVLPCASAFTHLDPFRFNALGPIRTHIHKL